MREHRTKIFLLIQEAIPVTSQSKAWVCGRSLLGMVGSNPSGALMSFSSKCCLLSGRILCVGLITLPEGSDQVWCCYDLKPR